MADHAYFFMGNCQLQYLSAMVGAVTSAERFFVGHRYNVNVALDGPWAPNVERKEFLRSAQRARREGKRTILIAQETSRSAYAHRIAKKLDLFDDFILFPHTHFGSQWPQRRLKAELDKITDKQVKRLFDWERHDFLNKLRRCELDAPEEFAERYWQKNFDELRFYHPGHSNGELFAEILEAMRSVLADRLPCYEDLIAALRRSKGIYQNSTHPVSARVADLLGLSWSRTDLYQAWLGIADAPDRGSLGTAVAMAEAVLDDPERLGVVAWPTQAHFLAALGAANAKLERRERGLHQLEQATITLKGFGPLLRRTMTLAVKAKRIDVVEHVLIEAAPFVEVTGAAHPGFEACVQGVLALPDGRAALARVGDAAAPETWMHGYLQGALAAA